MPVRPPAGDTHRGHWAKLQLPGLNTVRVIVSVLVIWRRCFETLKIASFAFPLDSVSINGSVGSTVTVVFV